MKLTQKLVEDHFEWMEAEAARYGYKFYIRVDEDGFPLIKFETNNSEMPEISIQTVKFGEYGTTCYQFEPTLKFPDLSFNAEYDYTDHIHYVISLWADLGRFITKICKAVYDPSDYIDE